MNKTVNAEATTIFSNQNQEGKLTEEKMVDALHTGREFGGWLRQQLKSRRLSGETHTRAGIQVYRIEASKLAETWLQFQPLGSVWDRFRCAEALDELAANQVGRAAGVAGRHTVRSWRNTRLMRL